MASSEDASARGGAVGGQGTAGSPAGPSNDSGDATDARGACPVEVVQLPVVGGCASDVAKRAFKFAICSCSGLEYSGTITTSSFSSATNKELLAGGSVGVNGTYRVDTTDTTLGGSLWVQDYAEFSDHHITGALHVGGAFQAQNVRVDGDAYLAGNAEGDNVTIGGRLFASQGKSISDVSATGGTVLGQVAVPVPCDCSERLDIRAIVDYYATHNDNAARNVAENALMDLTGATERVLRCGRYFFSRIDPWRNDLTLRVEGRTVIAVDGPIESDAVLRIQIEPGAELDLFVAGDIDLNGPLEVGDRARPAATRIYGNGDFWHASDASLAANVYVANGRFVASTRMELWGSLFVGSLSLSGTMAVHYDQAILDVDGCAASGRECNGCGQCANPEAACVNGHCTTCTADTQCCPPLLCENGRCVAGVVIR